MKMPDKDYEELRRLMLLQLGHNPDLLEKYQSKGLTHARYRWDVLWSIVDTGAFDLRELYKQDDTFRDSHLDTALRRITTEHEVMNA